MSVTEARSILGPWGMQEIARYARVSRDTVNKWRSRTTGFPDERTMSGNPYWWPDMVAAWLRETDRTPTFEIMASDGSESDDQPGWFISDGEDCARYTIPFEDGSTIQDAVAAFVRSGHLPPVALTKTEKMDNPYSWQPSGYEYRWHLTQISLPTSAAEWSDALDAFQAATGMPAGEVISWAYSDGTACWVPVDPEHPEADDERGVLASGGWAVRYSEQGGYWSGETVPAENAS